MSADLWNLACELAASTRSATTLLQPPKHLTHKPADTRFVPQATVTPLSALQEGLELSFNLSLKIMIRRHYRTQPFLGHLFRFDGTLTRSKRRNGRRRDVTCSALSNRPGPEEACTRITLNHQDQTSGPQHHTDVKLRITTCDANKAHVKPSCQL